MRKKMTKKEYPLTLMQALEQIFAGKTVSNNKFYWYRFKLDTVKGSIIEFDPDHPKGICLDLTLHEHIINAKWRVEND